MGLNKAESLMQLTASCEIMVRNVGRAGGYVALEITQGKAAGEEVTTLLLRRDRARELASVLLRHSGDAGVSVRGQTLTHIPGLES
jgi:hypothetical protein